MTEQYFFVIWNLRISSSTGRLRYESEGPVPRQSAENIARGLKLAGCTPHITPIAEED